jgi:hypothetical protein
LSRQFVVRLARRLDLWGVPPSQKPDGCKHGLVLKEETQPNNRFRCFEFLAQVEEARGIEHLH